MLGEANCGRRIDSITGSCNMKDDADFSKRMRELVKEDGYIAFDKFGQ